MSGVTLSDLSKYHQGAMKWFKDGLVSEQNKLFAQTEEAGAVSFWPLGGTPLEGKVKFSFKETPPASGDKGPENPSAIAGVSAINVTRCGKNLLRHRTDLTFPYKDRGITYTDNGDGTYTANGTCPSDGSADSWLYFCYSGTTAIWRNAIPIYSGVGKYAVSGCPSGGSSSKYLISSQSHTATFRAIDTGSGVVGTARTDEFTNLGIKILKGQTVNNLVFAPQIEAGETATEFEKPEYDDYTIQLGNTYYGGEIDLATGVMTVTHVGFQPSRTYLQSSTVVATGTQNIWQIYLGKISSLPTNTFNYNDAAGYGGADYRCNYFQWDRTGNTKSFHTSGGFVYASFEGATAEEARQNCLNLYDTAVANNNPLTVVYPLATPYTVQLDPLQLTALTQKDKYTPRINTVYTDADSIQIRYRKSLIHDEDEKVQAIVALGGNV